MRNDSRTTLPSEANKLRGDGRLIVGLTTLVEQVPNCTVCRAEGVTAEALVKGRTKAGETAVLCGRHFSKLVNLFIKLCLGNAGRLSATKRKKHFAMLSSAEVGAMEKVVRAKLRAS